MNLDNKYYTPLFILEEDLVRLYLDSLSMKTTMKRTSPSLKTINANSNTKSAQSYSFSIIH